jgi:hypothetical protein
VLGVLRMRAWETGIVFFPQQLRLGTSKHQTGAGRRSDQLEVAWCKPFAEERIEP